MRQLREKYNLDDTSTGVVTKDDIEDVVAPLDWRAHDLHQRRGDYQAPPH